MSKYRQTEQFDIKFRGYHVLSKAWYAEANLRGRDLVDEVVFGLYVGERGETDVMRKW